MIIVDTHCHAGLTKYEPVESLLRHMETSGVDQAVLIQYMGNTDNGYLVDCLARFPGKLAAAMIVPQEDDGSAVRRWAERGIQGIRLRPDARAAAADPMAQWRAADEEGLVVSAPSRPEWLLSAQFAEVTDTFPDLRIVIITGYPTRLEDFEGADDLLQKPFSLDELVGRVRKALDRAP